MGDYENALSSFLKSYDIFEKKGNKHAMSNLSNSIGNVYTGLRNHRKAIESFQASYDLAKEVGNGYMMAVASIGLGNSYNDDGNTDKALEYFINAKNEFDKVKMSYPLAVSYASIASVYEKKNNYDGALKNYEEAIRLAREINEQYVIAMSYRGMAAVYTKQGMYRDALAHLTVALSMSQQAKARDNMKDIYLDIANVYREQKDYAKALENYELYAQYKDSIFNEQSANSISEMQTRYDTDRKEKEIELLNKNQQIKDEALKRQYVVSYSVGGGLLLVLGMAFVMYRGYVQKRKANVLLADQNKEIQDQKSIIEEKSRGIVDSIRYAERIQQALFPEASVVRELLPDSFIFYKPKDIVSGDFYWIENRHGKIYFAAVDCTGHGVPGALMSIVGYNGLNQAVNEYMLQRPGEILDHLNKNVKSMLGRKEENSAVMDGMDISLCAYDSKARSIEFAGAFNSLYHVREGVLTELKGDKTPITASVREHRTSFTTQAIDVHKGDCLYLFTDGFADQFGGPQGKKFKYSNLKGLLVNISHMPMSQQREKLSQAFDAWRGDLEQVDDVLVMGVKM